MADTTAAAGLTPQQWDDKFFVEYVQHNVFAPEMGTGTNNIIQVKEDLTKKRGDSLTYALVNRLTAAGVTGNGTLEGNEEAMDTRSHKLTVDQYRNGVRVSDYDEQLSSIQLRDAARDTLQTWAMEKSRDQTIEALGSINRVPYSTATEPQKDAWLADNADRVLFGDAKGNGGYTDMSADLLTVTAAMKFSTAVASLMKRIALTATPRVKPITVMEANGKRFYKVYLDPWSFRDLQTDPVIQQAQREVSVRMQNVKLFEGGDLEWDGMIFKQVDDIASLGAVGDTSATVSPAYLCGAQAIGQGWAKRWKTVTEEFDYTDKKGIAVAGFYGIEKLLFGAGTNDTDDLKDHGVVTGYVGAAADA